MKNLKTKTNVMDDHVFNYPIIDPISLEGAKIAATVPQFHLDYGPNANGYACLLMALGRAVTKENLMEILSGFEICASALGVVDDTAVKCSKLGAHFKNAASSGIALASEFKLSDELCTFFSVVRVLIS